MNSADLRAVLVVGFIVLAVIVVAVNSRIQKRREWEAYYKTVTSVSTVIPPGYALRQAKDDG